MSVIDSLVYNRTLSDVTRVFTLKNKILSGGLSSLTTAEKSEYMAGMRGAYNYTDMNRVGQAVLFIANRMTTLPGQLDAYRESLGVGDDVRFHVPYDPADVVVTGKTDWAMGDTPSQSQVTAYLNDLTVLRRQLTLPGNTPAVPSTLDNLTYATANNIENLLFVVDTVLSRVEVDLYKKIANAASGYMYSSEIYSGEI